jgi:TPR repeat protein
MLHPIPAAAILLVLAAAGPPSGAAQLESGAGSPRAELAGACERGSARACFDYLEKFYAFDVLEVYGSGSDEVGAHLDRSDPAVRTNARRAYETSRRACDAGRDDACGAAGLILAWAPYAESLDLKADRDLGLRLLARACVAGHAGSCRTLHGKVIAQADAVERRKTQGASDLMRESQATLLQALRLLQDGCATGAWACNYAGLLFERGSAEGAFGRNPSLARSRYSQAAELAKAGCDAGRPWDCAALGWLYAGTADGMPFAGIGADRKLAASLYARACRLDIDDGGEACRFAREFEREVETVMPTLAPGDRDLPPPASANPPNSR